MMLTMMMMNKFTISILFIFLIILKLNSAVEYIWVNHDNTGRELFNNQSNWNPQSIPNLNDNVLIDNGGALLIDTVQKVSSFSLPNGTVILEWELYVSNTMNIIGTTLGIGAIRLSHNALLVPKTLNLDGGLFVVVNLINSDGFFIHDGSIVNSTITCDNGGLILLDKGSSLFLNNITMVLNGNSSIVLDYNTKFLMNIGIVEMDGYSTIDTNFSTVYFGALHLYAYSTAAFRDSMVLVFSDSTINEQGQIAMESTYYISTGLTLNDQSSVFLFDDTRFFMTGDFKLNDNSQFFCGGYNSSVVINQTLIAKDMNAVLFINCSLSVLAEASFQILQMENSEFFINYKSTLKEFTLLSNATVAINGTLIVQDSALLNLFDSNAVSVGDFDIYGDVEGSYSLIKVNDGNLNLFFNSSLYLEHSTLHIKKGYVLLDEHSTFTMLNTSLLIENGGIIKLKGGFSLSENSNINNIGGEVNIYSGIYYGIDQTIKSNKISISNIIGGVVNIENSIDINVAFNNTGLLNVNGNGTTSLFIYDYSQSNGGLLQIKNGNILKSDNNFKFNGGIINGNGTIDQTIIHTSGQIGTNSSINSLNITGDYTSSKSSKIIINIDTLDKFSILNIGKNANVQGLIEIRISINLLSILFPNVFISDYNDQQQSSNSSSSTSIPTPPILNIINFNSKSESSFNNIQFKSYSPKTGDESGLDLNCIKSESSSSSLSVLFNSEDDCLSKSKLSGGQIAGIVIGCVAFTVAIITIIHFRERIRLTLKTIKL